MPKSPPLRCWPGLLPSSQFPLHKRSPGHLFPPAFRGSVSSTTLLEPAIIFLEARATLPYLSADIFFLRFRPPGAFSAAHRRHRRAAERLSLWSTFCAQGPCNCIRPHRLNSLITASRQRTRDHPLSSAGHPSDSLPLIPGDVPPPDDVTGTLFCFLELTGALAAARLSSRRAPAPSTKAWPTRCPSTPSRRTLLTGMRAKSRLVPLRRGSRTRP